MKRLLSILLCLAMLLSMAACGMKEKTPAESQPAQPPQSDAAAPDNAPDKAPDTKPDAAQIDIDEMAAKPAPQGAVGYIDISINPLVRLYFDVNDVIIEVRYLNGDAKEAFEEKFEELEIEGVGLDEGIRAVVETSIEKGYLKDDAPVTMGVEVIEKEKAVKKDLEKLAEETILAVIETSDVTAVVTVVEKADEVVEQHKAKNPGNNGNHNGQITPDDAPNSSQQGNGQKPGQGQQTNTGAPGNSGGNNNAGGNNGNNGNGNNGNIGNGNGNNGNGNGNGGSNRPSVDDDDDDDDWFVPGGGSGSGGSGSDDDTPAEPPMIDAALITMRHESGLIVSANNSSPEAADNVYGRPVGHKETFTILYDGQEITDYTVTVNDSRVLSAKVENGKISAEWLTVGETYIWVNYQGKSASFKIAVNEAVKISLIRDGNECLDGYNFLTIDSMEMAVRVNGTTVTDFTVVSNSANILTAVNETGRVVVNPLAVGEGSFTVSHSGASATYTVTVQDGVILMRHCTGGMTVSASGTKPGVEDNISIYYPDKGHEEDLAIIYSNEDERIHEEIKGFTFWAEDPDILELTYNEGKIHMVCKEEGDTAIWVEYLGKQFWFRIVVEPAGSGPQPPVPSSITLTFQPHGDSEEHQVPAGGGFGMRYHEGIDPSIVRIYKDGVLVPNPTITFDDPQQTAVFAEKLFADGTFEFTPTGFGREGFTVTAGDESQKWHWYSGKEELRFYNTADGCELAASELDSGSEIALPAPADITLLMKYDDGTGQYIPDKVTIMDENGDGDWDAKLIEQNGQFLLHVTAPADAQGEKTVLLMADYGERKNMVFGITFTVSEGGNVGANDPFQLGVQFPNASESIMEPGSRFGVRRFQTSVPNTILRVYKDGEIVSNATITFDDPDQNVVTVSRGQDGGFVFTSANLGLAPFTVTVGEDSLDYIWNGGVDWIRLYNLEAPFHLVGVAGVVQDCEWTRVAPGTTYRSSIYYDNGFGEFNPDSVTLVSGPNSWNPQVEKEGSAYFFKVTVPADAAGTPDFVLNASYGGAQNDFGVAFKVDGTVTPPQPQEKKLAIEHREGSRMTDGGHWSTLKAAQSYNIYYGNEIITGFAVQGENDSVATFEKTEDGKLLITPVGTGDVGFTISYDGKTIRVSVGVRAKQIERSPLRIAMNGQNFDAGNSLFMISNSNSAVLVDVLYEGQPIDDFTVDGENDSVAQFANENGQVKIIPIKTGGIGFSVTYKGVSYRFSTVILRANAVELKENGTIWRSIEGRVRDVREMEVLHNGTVVSDFTVEGGNDEIATFENVNGKLVVTPKANGEVSYRISVGEDWIEFNVEVSIPEPEPLPDLEVHYYKNGTDLKVLGNDSGFSITEEVDLEVRVNGRLVSDFNCWSENDDAATVKNENGRLIITPKRNGHVGIGVSHGEVKIRMFAFVKDQTYTGSNYIHVWDGVDAIYPEGSEISLITEQTFFIVRDSMANPITDFEVFCENEKVAKIKNVDGQLMIKPAGINNGGVGFTIIDNATGASIRLSCKVEGSGIIEDGEDEGEGNPIPQEGLCIARDGGFMSDTTEFATLMEEEDLTVYLNGKECTDFTCSSENTDYLIVKNADGKLRLIPVADGWVGFSVKHEGKSLYIRLAVGVGGTEVGPAPADVGIVWNGKTEGNGFHINRLLKEVSTDVIVSGAAVADFECVSENTEILAVKNDNGKLKLTPTGNRYGTVAFTVSYNGETSRIAVFVGDPNGFYGNDTGIGICRDGGIMGDGCVFSTVFEQESLAVVNGGSGHYITNFTVKGYDDSIATFAVVDGKLVMTPVSSGEVIFEITDNVTGETAIFKGYFEVAPKE